MKLPSWLDRHIAPPYTLPIRGFVWDGVVMTKEDFKTLVEFAHQLQEKK